MMDDILTRILLIVINIIIIILCINELIIRQKIKQLKDKLNNYLTFSKDSDTWEHNSPIQPGYITDSATGKMRPMTPEEKELYKR